MTHLKKWWIAYGATALGLAHNVWPQVREYVCTHPVVSGSTFLGIVVTALLKTSPASHE